MRDDQKDFFIGKLLGDGSLENRGNAHSRFQIRHSIKQKLYVDWCYLQIKEFTASAPKIHLDSYYFRTKSLPFFSEMRQKWYVNNIKQIPTDLILRPLSLAVWYMDDGYFDRKYSVFWLCTHSFTMLELNFLQGLLKNMDINTTYVKDRSHYKLRVVMKSCSLFKTIVSPFIVPSLYYKIGIAP